LKIAFKLLTCTGCLPKTNTPNSDTV